ncbi:hypothetical protein [Bradyrhizobium sp. B117]|uniref:hypothetical protein n=1 Tax=Bradyrhizobium sp. B117 TaxID=3140246 RepID=UPI0031839E87
MTFAGGIISIVSGLRPPPRGDAIQLGITQLLDRHVAPVNDLHGLIIQAIHKLPNVGKIALLRLVQQLVGDPAHREGTVAKRDPERVIALLEVTSVCEDRLVIEPE